VRGWQACEFVHAQKPIALGPHFRDTDHQPRWLMGLRPGAMPRPVGLRWVVTEMGAQFNERPALWELNEMTRDQRVGIGPELTMLAAMHPRWATTLKQNQFPFLYVTDMQLKDEHGQWVDCLVSIRVEPARGVTIIDELKVRELHATGLDNRSRPTGLREVVNSESWFSPGSILNWSPAHVVRERNAPFQISWDRYCGVSNGNQVLLRVIQGGKR